MQKSQLNELFSRSRLTLRETFEFQTFQADAETIVRALEPRLTEKRLQRIEKTIESRTLNVMPILENVHDIGNICAVMRSAEAFGFLRFSILEYSNHRFRASNRVTKGTDKWLDVRMHSSVQDCLERAKDEGFRVFATSLEASHSIEEIDWTQPSALVFGNEKEGVSEELSSKVDGTFKIPMTGFAQSFNISVAAAIAFYHVYRSRSEKLGKSGDLKESEKTILKANYLLRSLSQGERVLRKTLEAKF